MNENLRYIPIGLEDLPEELSSRAKRCISLAVRDGRLESPELIREMSDIDVMWGVRGDGQPHGIGTKTLENVRSVYPKTQ